MAAGNRLRIVAVLLVVAACAACARADGKFKSLVAVEKTPAIPHQRALIVWDDGVETLVVSSAFDTESESVGWILPLPNEPTAMEVVDPGLLVSLHQSLRPAYTDVEAGDTTAAWMALAMVLPLPLVLFFIRPGHGRRTVILLAGQMAWVLGVLLVSAYDHRAHKDSAQGGPEVAPGVEVRDVRRVGNYEVAVLKADDAADVSAWLGARGFHGLTKDEVRVVDEYIKAKWCFVVARLRRQGAGPASPHPISLKFKTPQCVYPMKLTGLAGGEVQVDLFVVADKQAWADGFACEAADLFAPVSGPLDAPRYFEPGVDPESALGGRHVPEAVAAQRVYHGGGTGLVIGSPDAGAFLGDGRVVTRLSAKLGPEQMTADVLLGETDLRPMRRYYVTAAARNAMVARTVLFGAAAFWLVVAVSIHGGRRPGKWAIALLIGIAVGAAAGAIAQYRRAEVRDVEYRHAPKGYSMHGRMREIDYLLRQADLQGLPLATMTPAEIGRTLEKMYADRQAAVAAADQAPGPLNPMTGLPMQAQRSAGNFWVRTTGQGRLFCLYDQDGVEYWMPIHGSAEPTTQPTTQPTSRPTTRPSQGGQE